EGWESWKYAPSTTSPMTTGSAPLSPLRTRRSQTRVYSPSELVSRSGELLTAISDGSSPAPGSPAPATAPAASSLIGSWGPVDDIPQPSEPLLASGDRTA